jgi:hypothetical protein
MPNGVRTLLTRPMRDVSERSWTVLAKLANKVYNGLYTLLHDPLAKPSRTHIPHPLA